MHKNLFVVSIVVLAVGQSCNCGAPPLVTNPGSFSIESNELDFGPVTELTQKTMSVKVRNLGRGPLMVGATIDPMGSQEFALDGGMNEIAAQGEANFAVTFSPVGPGEDVGGLLFTSNDPDQLNARVNLHGGKIFPALEFDPDGGFLSFSPTSMLNTSKFAIIRSTGGSTLHVTAVGVNPFGSPDFAVTLPTLPATLAPGQTLAVQVDYAKTMNMAEGLLEVVCDDADAGLRTLRLLPDPAHACSDGEDNEKSPDGGSAADGLIDFPNDPGCTGPDDEDEYNPPECVNGAMRTCGSSVGICRPGNQQCANSIWGQCAGSVAPQPETCNGLDDNCMMGVDEMITDLCTINGCQGVKSCIANSGVDGGSYGACMPITATAEVCDGIDNDCNGAVDNGIVEQCTINGCLGTRICIPGGDGGYTMCAAANPATETCNGIDDDCDGTIDDVQPMVQSCGFGVCARTAPACVDGGIPVCMPGMGGTETCNGIDDDCDGTADDNLGSNTCGVGACFRSVPACVGGGNNACVPGMQSTELCNNADDDCDMVTDEGPDGGTISQTCFTVPAAQRNVGRCRDGMQFCSSGGFLPCSGEITPIAESCNNIDDNCSGMIDESLSVACYDAGVPATRGVGRCRDGTAACASGMYGNCTGQTGPIAEVCGNSIDEACNGNADETCPSDGGPCDINGVWRVDGGNIAYTCAFGLVNISISQFNFATNVPAAGTMTVAPQFTWSPGSANFLRGPNASCPAGAMDVSALYTGSCNENYRLQGSFTSANTFVGTFSMTYTGTCFGCTNRTIPALLYR